jgi:steroid delta-isomerase-like uncharacterized protein
VSTTTKRLTKAEIRALATGFVKAMNDGDVEATVGYCTDDVAFKEPFGEVVRGKEAIRASMTESEKAFKDFHIPLEDVEMYFGDDRTAVVVTYTMIATMSGPTMGVPASGRTMRVKAAMIAKIRDGLVSEGTILYDSLDAGEQLGLLPSYDSLAMRLIMGAELVATRARRALPL